MAHSQNHFGCPIHARPYRAWVGAFARSPLPPRPCLFPVPCIPEANPSRPISPPQNHPRSIPTQTRKGPRSLWPHATTIFRGLPRTEGPAFTRAKKQPRRRRIRSAEGLSEPRPRPSRNRRRTLPLLLRLSRPAPKSCQGSRTAPKSSSSTI